MSDKDKIKKEIERRISQFEAKYPKDLGGYWNDEESAAYNCAEEYKRFLQFIDSLPKQPVSEDLEEEIDICWEGWIDPNPEVKGVDGYLSKDEFSTYARHFAEWQRKKDFQNFIGKACEWLCYNTMRELLLDSESTELVKDFVDDFKTYIQKQ